MTTIEHDHPATADETYREQVQAFRIHAAVFATTVVLIMAFNMVLNLASGGSILSTWWSIWVLIGWTPGISVHGLVVRLARPTPSVA